MAVADYKDALEISERRIALDADDEDARQNRATYNGEMAYALLDLKRMDEAEQSLLSATQWFRERYERSPERGAYQRNMLVQHVQLHEFYKGWGTDESKRSVTKCSEHCGQDQSDDYGNSRRSDCQYRPTPQVDRAHYSSIVRIPWRYRSE